MISSRFRHLCRAWIGLAVLFEISAVAQTSTAPATIVFSNTRPIAIPRRSSIILVVANGLGYGDLSCYGQTNYQTPNLDKLAAEGIRFTNYSAAETPMASEAALMLGKEATHPGGDGLTVAQLLKEAGYHTGLAGEWTLGDDRTGNAPWKKGFDEFAGYMDADPAQSTYADYIYRYAPKALFTSDNQRTDFVGRESLYRKDGAVERRYVPDLLAKVSDNFIHNNCPDAFNRFRPFFLVLHYPIPGNGSQPAPSDAPFSDEPWKPAEKNRAAIINRFDGYIGQLRGQLAKNHLTNNVTIFVTSDSPAQGPAAEFFHSNLATNDLRVPMILFGPVPVPGGRVSELRWSGKDFLPTAAGIGFAKTPAGIDGASILPAVSKVH
jgi:arylsulfatase A-like enzyme